ncbi:MAG: hypothetical protein KJN72_12095 [Woeseia sp.]|nr:hypothetical protein [Woeseia sp.]
MPYLETLAEKQAKLAELQEVYDRAIAGETEIEISDTSGGSVKYSNPNTTNLRARIRELENQISAVDGSTPPSRRSAVRIYYA